MLIIIRSINKDKIHVFFQDNLIQTQDVKAAVMAYDTTEKKFVNMPVSQDISDTGRYIFYSSETDLFELLFGKVMPGYIKALNDFNIEQEPSRYIGVLMNITEDEYKQYAKLVDLPLLKVLEAAKNG